MELSKKTTILFPPELHEHLVKVAHQRGVSLGTLVRQACESAYGSVRGDTRRTAVRQLADMSLPVADPDTLGRESVPTPGELLP